MAKESPKPPKSDKKKRKVEEKEEKRRKKDLKKSKESLPGEEDNEPSTPKTKKKKEKKAASPDRGSQCSSGGEYKQKKGLFKRIGSFMLPAPALAPASPTAQEKVVTSQSCVDLATSPSSKRGLASNSASQPNLFSHSTDSMPPNSPPPPGIVRNNSAVSVEYSLPVRRLEASLSQPFLSSDDDISPRRSSMKSSPSPRKDRRISFAGEDFDEGRVVTPDILKKDLAAALGLPPAPAAPYVEVIDLPEPSDLAGLAPEERCEEQEKLLKIYEEKIHTFRDQVLEIVSENTRLQAQVSKQDSQDIQMVQKQAQQVLQENRTLMKEQQMNQARWQDLIEERNSEVLRIRAICSNMEEQNTTLLKRCNKLEEKNEEIREAYNSIASSATQADDFVPVAAHLSSMEGYKVALEELRKRYDDNIHDKNEELEGAEMAVAELTERIEVLEEEKALLVGQVKGLKDSLERSQHNGTRHKREAVQLTQRVNTLKLSLAQAINIAEQSTLQKLEFAEILQISDMQDKQHRTFIKQNNNSKVKEVKKLANAKLKSCADIIQERDAEHERSITVLNDRITKLKLRCQTKDEQIQNLTNSDKTLSN